MDRDIRPDDFEPWPPRPAWTPIGWRALQRLTLALVESCFRNSILEDWHAGREVVSPAD